MRAGILIFPDVEVLDFAGPYEVFATTRLDESRRHDEPSPFDVKTVSPSPGVVAAAGGLRILPDHGLDDCPPLDVLVVPGGRGARRERENRALLDWIVAQTSQVDVLASVCTGAMILARAGLLDGRPATTHWRSLGWLRENSAADVRASTRVVEDGNLMTSAGVSAGIDLALAIVARCFGPEVARATARNIEYPPA